MHDFLLVNSKHQGKCFWTIQVILNIGPCLFVTDFIDIQSGEVSIG